MKPEIPLLWGDPGDEPLFTAAQFIDYLVEANGLERKVLPDHAIITFDPSFLRRVESHLGKADEHWLNFKIYRRSSGDFTLMNAGVGASKAVAELEELIACGARHIVALGSGGALQPDMEIGEVVVVERAIRDEGTSFHYLGPSWDVEADPGWSGSIAQVLTAAGLTPRTGATWTTDGVYRETRRKIARMRADGVLTVEMEASALFAVARFHSVKLASVLIVSDLLAGEQWQPRFYSKVVGSRVGPVVDAIMAAFEAA